MTTSTLSLYVHVYLFFKFIILVNSAGVTVPCPVLLYPLYTAAIAVSRLLLPLLLLMNNFRRHKVWWKTINFSGTIYGSFVRRTRGLNNYGFLLSINERTASVRVHHLVFFLHFFYGLNCNIWLVLLLEFNVFFSCGVFPISVPSRSSSAVRTN